MKKTRNYWLGAAMVGVLVFAFGFSGCATIKKVSDTGKQKMCRNNLVNLERAKAMWALDKNKKSGAGPNWDDLVGTEKYLSKKPTCPAEGEYSVNDVGAVPTCSVEGHGMR